MVFTRLVNILWCTTLKRLLSCVFPPFNLYLLLNKTAQQQTFKAQTTTMKTKLVAFEAPSVLANIHQDAPAQMQSAESPLRDTANQRLQSTSIEPRSKKPCLLDLAPELLIKIYEQFDSASEITSFNTTSPSLYQIWHLNMAAISKSVLAHSCDPALELIYIQKVLRKSAFGSVIFPPFSITSRRCSRKRETASCNPAKGSHANSSSTRTNHWLSIPGKPPGCAAYTN